MNKENLNELNLSELRVLCRNRELRTTSKTTKQSAISKISSYHQKKGYKQLQFKEKINEWRKAELVAEAKAVGAGNLAAKTKKNIVSTILNPPTSVSKKKGKTNDSGSDFESNSNNKNKNKKKAKAKSKAKKITKLSQKKQSIIACCKQLESIMIDVFNDLKGGYKPKHKKAAHQVHDFREYEELPILSNDLTYDLDDFGDKILALLPLVLEAKSMVHDFEEYINKINKLSEKKSEKQLYYVGIRKYAKKSNYENDPIGPVCGVFNDSKQFDGFRNDKKIQKKYGKNIKRFRFMLDDDESEKKNNKNSKEADHKMDVDSESEFSDEEIVSGKVENEDRDDNASVATEEALDEKRKEKDDLMVSSEDEDEDEDDVENNEKNKNKAAETVINDADNDDDEEESEDEKTEDEETEDENEADEEDQGDEDDDIDMEKNKKNEKNKNRKNKKKNKKKNISKNTRSRRSREEKNNKLSGKKRKRDGDDISGNEQKRKKARLNENENETDVNPELPPVLSG